ncbi:hypothetical protein TVAG_006290 [Trichomonas vaginalis G3]|uniref:DNA-directed RNA polymerase III subunit n=1 Tax=Trichomonas vaginalis (strain ATCC PRA-98 / G3) TaxID=412133 RepID=A2E736_TRIV3|nr:hypothetical protein TVAGG3_0982830 [Trichomonas vaginalis G3]EAY11554.1 hypothetical protein TVAG_006290 [Trichomonas vaginalis G3]KAI5489438.1 hypothetical protein TVAGG3_0982830 [Trichomonas vaginalis G3]|eukprot:XP_001323777.1 hypothetical protein [Trichomonas vaginalis G3]
MSEEKTGEQKTTEQTPKPSEEVLYPDRPIELMRLPNLARTAGAADHQFISAFRKSPFYFETSLSQQQERVLNPTRHELLKHITTDAPTFAFPACLLNPKDKIKSLEELKGQQAEVLDEDTVRLEFKNTTSITSEDVIDQAKLDSSDDDEEKSNSEDDEDMAADYAAQYGDQETGDVDDEDDDDEGDDDE